MEENCVIVGLNHENEVELELGLSIGGSFKRVEKLKPFKKDQIRNRTPDSDLTEKSVTLTAAEQESDAAADPQRKREIQAMRRKEAKMKREEKQQKRGLSCKKIKVECSGSSDGETKNSAGAQNAGRNLDPNPAFSSAIPVPVPPCPYPEVQGFVNPCGTTGTPPCWSGVSGGNDRNAAVNQGFRPFKGSQTQNSGSGLESDPNSSCCKDDSTTGIKKSVSNGSTVCTDLQSSSNQGGGSSSNIEIGPKCQLEETATSHQTQEPAATGEDKKQPKDDSNKTIVDSENKAPPISSPPPCMPCVSTRGDGPNGRTVNGFLYRYSSQTDVSIVCVCHGSSFSPAEFVEHAGGTAVSQPLRHITVIPSAF